MTKSKQKIWLISDTHFGHTKLIDWNMRITGFEYEILNNLALQTRADDIVIHLGDVCMGRDEYWHEVVLGELSDRQWILVRGNHDNKSDSWYRNHGWDFVCTEFKNTFFGKKLMFTHQPQKDVPEDYINIHGHMHNMIEKDISDKHRLVSMEWQNMKPVLLESFIS